MRHNIEFRRLHGIIDWVQGMNKSQRKDRYRTSAKDACAIATDDEDGPPPFPSDAIAKVSSS